MTTTSDVLERIVRELMDDGVSANPAGLALRILRSIQAGDDIGNGLRAISISALEELRQSLLGNIGAKA